ncbi:MAG: hypothetical protein ABI779_00270 [Acidobacteriota bacterium]
MRYKITAGDDESYQNIERYLVECQPGHVKVQLPHQRILSADDLSDSTIRALKEFGARVAEEYQFAIDRVG